MQWIEEAEARQVLAIASHNGSVALGGAEAPVWWRNPIRRWIGDRAALRSLGDRTAQQLDQAADSRQMPEVVNNA